MKATHGADTLKIAILEWLLDHRSADEVVGSEIRFLDGRYRADIVVASPTRLSAIEVKGAKDDLRRLPVQLAGYQQSFLDVSVAVSDIHVSKIRNVVSASVGLMSVSGDHITVLRQPRCRRYLSKDQALAWLRVSDLKVQLRSQSKRPLISGNVIDMRMKVAGTLSTREASQIALTSVHDRMGKRFDAFISELGDVVTYDDLQMLKIENQIV